MTGKTRRMLMAMVGVYLAYIGVQLIRDTMAGGPKNQIMLICFGAVFAVMGLLTAVLNVKAYLKENRQEQSAKEGSEEESPEEVQTEEMHAESEDGEE